MYIKSIGLENFQCFKEKTIIELEKDITCLIGNNGSGKSAVLEGLQRVFGNSLEKRTIVKSDFYIASNETEKDIKNRTLIIDVLFEFDDQEETENLAFFSPVIYEASDEKFHARMRLEATWTDAEYEDEVYSTVFWVLTDADVEIGDMSELKVRVEPHERKQIQLVYIPAIRNARNILRNDMHRLVKKIERYTDVSDDTIKLIEQMGETIEQKFDSITAIKSITGQIDKIWKRVHDNTLPHYNDIKLEVVSSKFEDLIKSLMLLIAPGEHAETKEFEELSDGQVSLLYFALSLSLHVLEQQHCRGQLEGLKAADYEAPIFTIIALEEPENHMSPFYLSRLLSVLIEHTNNKRTIGIITSHSPNVVKRMERVGQIRFLIQKSNGGERKSLVKKIILPDKKRDDDYKYINQAILAHPELYFSKFVILMEGASEEIILPTIFRKYGYNLDASFVAFVRLEGRHVNHMWRLLQELEIPYITLLDYDCGRFGGGIDRVTNIETKLKLEPTGDRKALEDHNVYFSYPLDLDMMMIQAFPNLYSDGGIESTHEELVTSVLGKKGKVTDYKDVPFFEDSELKKYRYLFKTKSKVVAHYLACDGISSMDKKEFLEKLPSVLKSMMDKILTLLKK